ncbi:MULTISPECIES: hypothetical protein [unclassified Microbacterium]|uniref:hypothetical protein n=1 Tax=unclassified Microbacterium TaxID=2609290 RepID=UPI0012FE6187|nr:MULTISPECIES: hypothetical protein [unclassified Microbacterium]
MRLTGYVLAADPWWIEESVLSYYDVVDRLVVSYDENATSWSGGPIPVEECLRRLRRIDSAGKLDFVPGSFARPDIHALEAETLQRSQALRRASADADWVIQLDSDEVVGNLETFVACIEEAERHGAGGLDYPSRYFMGRSSSGRLLETSTRWWRPYAHYPAPMAVRAGSRLVHARQAEVALYRTDFRPDSTSPLHARDAVVHRVIPVEAGIRHYSRVRSQDYMERKSAWSAHADYYARELARWRTRQDHPIAAVVATPFAKPTERFRLTSLPPQQRYWRGEFD